MKSNVISIIVPVYNAEEFLSQTIKSIVDQTYEKFELILVNDGSKDKSESIILDWISRDSRLVYHKQENKGPSATRNVGIDLSRGDYLLFVDADDQLNPNVLEQMVADIKEADVLLFGYENHHGINSTKNNTVLPMIEGNYSVELFVPFFGEFFKHNLIHYIWNKLYKKESIKGILFDEKVKVGEDLLFNLEVLNSIETLSLTRKALYTHNWSNEESITSKFHRDLFDYRKKQFYKVKNFLENHRSYIGDNKEIVDKEFFGKYVTCMLSMESEDASLTFKEKILTIKTITLGADHDQLLIYKDKKTWEKMVVFLMRRKWFMLLFVLNKGLKIIQDRIRKN